MDIFSSRVKGIDGRFRSIREKPTGLASQRSIGDGLASSWISNYGKLGPELDKHPTFGRLPRRFEVWTPWSKGMYQRFQRVIGLLKRALRKDQRLTVEEFNRLLQLSEAIIDYGRMIHEYCGFTVTFVIVEIPELARRFRETPQAIEDALLLLRDMGRAEPIHLHGCWKLQLAGILISGREGPHSATRHVHSHGDDNRDLGAA